MQEKRFFSRMNGESSSIPCANDEEQHFSLSIVCFQEGGGVYELQQPTKGQITASCCEADPGRETR